MRFFGVISIWTWPSIFSRLCLDNDLYSKFKFLHDPKSQQKMIFLCIYFDEFWFFKWCLDWVGLDENKLGSRKDSNDFKPIYQRFYSILFSFNKLPLISYYPSNFEFFKLLILTRLHSYLWFLLDSFGLIKDIGLSNWFPMSRTRRK